jgi:hypothetical protein
MAVDWNAYDGHTLKPQLMQVMELTKGRIGSIDIIMPKMLKKESYYLKK